MSHALMLINKMVPLNQNINTLSRLVLLHAYQQNGSAEPKHRHIVEIGLALLAHASMPLKFWDEAFTTAVYLINRLPSKVIQSQTPLERLFSITPDYSFLRIFGCAVWPNLRPFNKHKLQFRSTRCAFIGYSPLHKGYKCLDISTGRVYISRDVVFDESIFPFSELHENAGAQLRAEINLLPPALLNPPILDHGDDLHTDHVSFSDQNSELPSVQEDDFMQGSSNGAEDPSMEPGEDSPALSGAGSRARSVARSEATSESAHGSASRAPASPSRAAGAGAPLPSAHGDGSWADPAGRASSSPASPGVVGPRAAAGDGGSTATTMPSGASKNTASPAAVQEVGGGSSVAAGSSAAT